MKLCYTSDWYNRVPFRLRLVRRRKAHLLTTETSLAILNHKDSELPAHYAKEGKEKVLI